MDTFLYDDDFRRELKKQAHHWGEVEFLESLAEPGMTAFDIGANKGVTTVAIAKAVGPGGQVYAFEPVPEYFQTLQTNLSRNDVTNVVPFQMALGDKAGQRAYYKDGGGSGIVPHGAAEEIEVNVTTIDAIRNGHDLSSVDLLSMDCEGSEMLVLHGARDLLLQKQPLNVFCEIHRDRLKTLGQSLEGLLEFLEAHGFEVRPVLADDLDKEVSYGECSHIFAAR